MATVHPAVPEVQYDPFEDGAAPLTDEWLEMMLAPHEDGSPVFGSTDAPGVPTVPFPAWIELQASALRSHGTEAAGWLAGRLDELATLARFLKATTPAEFEAREEIADAELLAREFDRGVAWGGGGVLG